MPRPGWSRGFLRALLVFKRKSVETRFLQDLFAAFAYVGAVLGIVAYVLDIPVSGLLAASGVIAIVLGLALQSTLGDMFSGVVLNLAKPFLPGDWVILDGGIEGRVVETNWRATQILTLMNDLAIVPNSIIAKTRLVNASEPSEAPLSGCCLRLFEQACGCDVGACGFAIDVALGFGGFGSALAGGDLARVDMAGQAEQVLGQAGRVGLVPARPVFGRQSDEQALVAAPDLNGEAEARHLQQRRRRGGGRWRIWRRLVRLLHRALQQGQDVVGQDGCGKAEQCGAGMAEAAQLAGNACSSTRRAITPAGACRSNRSITEDHTEPTATGPLLIH